MSEQDSQSPATTLDAPEASEQQEGVAQTSAVEPRQRKRNKREEMVQRMLAKKRGMPEPGPAPATEVIDPEPELEPETTAATEPDPEEVTAPEPDSPLRYKDGVWMATRKVNGVDEEVPYDQILANEQKLTAGDERLRESAKKYQELQQYEQKLESMRQDLENRSKLAKTQQQTEDPSVLAHKYHELLLNGDMSDDNTQKELDDLMIRMQAAQRPEQPAPQIDPQQIINQASIKIRTDSWNKDLQAADAWVAKEHADIWGEPMLKQMASNQAQEIMRERIEAGKQIDPNFSQIDVDPREVYEGAVTRVSEWLKGRLAHESATRVNGRVNRKREASQQAATGTGATAQLPEAPKPLTAAEKVRQMRQARGLSR